MPQPAQHSLIQILLLWITILTIIQVVFIALFFTAGHHGLAKNRSDEESEKAFTLRPSPHSSSAHSDNGHLLEKGKMITFKGTGGSRTVKWAVHNPYETLVSNKEEVLTIEKDGFYFLSLQITLKSCAVHLSKGGPQTTVSVIWRNQSQKRVLLEGWINTPSCSTGVLSRATELPAGGTLEVGINLTNPLIDKTESLTHLDIIYLPKS